MVTLSGPSSSSIVSTPSPPRKRPRRSAVSSSISYVVPDSDDDMIADDNDDVMRQVKVIAKKRKVESNLQKWIKNLDILLKEEQRKVRRLRFGSLRFTERCLISTRRGRRSSMLPPSLERRFGFPRFVIHKTSKPLTELAKLERVLQGPRSSPCTSTQARQGEEATAVWDRHPRRRLQLGRRGRVPRTDYSLGQETQDRGNLSIRLPTIASPSFQVVFLG